MQISKLLLSLASISLASNVLAAPAPIDADITELEKRAVTVKLTTTLHQITTNVHVVDAPTTTITNTNIDTSTTTFTSYTATITSTIFGTPHTYTTVATTPINQKEVVINSSPASSPDAETTANPQTSTSADNENTETTANTNNAVTTTSTPNPTPTPDSTVAATTTQIDYESSAAPEITSSPSSSSDWIVEGVTTTTSNGVCVVSYDYYYASETDSYDETVTSTSTIYTTVTLA